MSPSRRGVLQTGAVIAVAGAAAPLLAACGDEQTERAATEPTTTPAAKGGASEGIVAVADIPADGSVVKIVDDRKVVVTKSAAVNVATSVEKSSLPTAMSTIVCVESVFVGGTEITWSITWITPLSASMSAATTVALSTITPFIALTEMLLPCTVATSAVFPAMSADMIFPGMTW